MKLADVTGIFKREDLQARPPVPVEFDVIYGAADDLSVTTALELSEAAIAIRSTKSHPLGAEVELRCFFDRDDPNQWVVAAAKVVRSDPDQLVLEFKGLTRAERVRLERFLKAARQA